MKDAYDLVVIGGGGHGLGVAFNLAKLGFTNVAVLEKGYLGSGASGRSTALIRGGGFHSREWIQLFHAGLVEFEKLSDQIRFNVLLAQRGYLLLALSDYRAELFREAVPRQNALGVRSRIVEADEVKDIAPVVDNEIVKVGVLQERGGTARHDALVWGYAREAKNMGVDIFPFTEARKVKVENSEVMSVVTSRKEIKTSKLVNCAGGWSVDVARMCGVNLPVKPYRLEALVTEPYKPFLDPVIVCPDVSSYCVQTSRGELVAGTEEDPYSSYKLGSTFGFLELVTPRLMKLIPGLKYTRVLRQWAGVIDITPDAGPVIDEADNVKGLYFDCCWGGYGFMPMPAGAKLAAEFIATGKKSPLIEPFSLSRFAQNRLIEEKFCLLPPPAAELTAEVIAK